MSPEQYFELMKMAVTLVLGGVIATLGGIIPKIFDWWMTSRKDVLLLMEMEFR